MAEEPFDPKIDVSLSLLNAQDSQAAQDLVTKLESVKESFLAIQTTLDSYDKTLKGIAASFTEVTQQAPTRQPAQPVSVGAIGAQARTALGQSVPAYQGGASDSRSTGDVHPKGLAGWISRAYESPNLQRAQNVPVLGSVYKTAGNLFGSLGKGLAGDQYQSWQSGNEGLAQAALTNLTGHAGTVLGTGLAFGISQPLTQLVTHPLSTVGLPQDVSSATSQLGYQRGGYIGDTGFSLPFAKYFEGPAAAQARQMFEDRLALTVKDTGLLRSGVAQDIVQQTAAAGFSGSEGSNINQNLMGPLYRNLGMAPSTISLFLGQLRTGAATVGQVKSELYDLATASRNASLNVSQMAQDTAQLSETLQQMGAPGGPKNVQLGTEWVTGTGLPVGVLQNAINNPFVQGVLTSQSGVPPQLIGTLPNSALLQGVTSALKMGQGMFRGLQGGTTKVQLPDGASYTVHTSAQQEQLAAAAQQIGMTYQQAKKYLGNQANVQLQGLIHSHAAMQQVEKEPGGMRSIQTLAQQAGITSTQLKSASGNKVSDFAQLARLSTQQQQQILQKAASAVSQSKNAKEAAGKQKVDLTIGLTKDARHLLTVSKTFGTSVKKAFRLPEGLRDGTMAATQYNNMQPGSAPLNGASHSADRISSWQFAGQGQ